MSQAMKKEIEFKKKRLDFFVVLFAFLIVSSFFVRWYFEYTFLENSKIIEYDLYRDGNGEPIFSPPLHDDFFVTVPASESQ